MFARVDATATGSHMEAVGGAAPVAAAIPACYLGTSLGRHTPPPFESHRMTFLTFVSLAAGLVLLFVGGDAIVRGAVALAQRFNVSRLVIGLTIVGFGTSLPELVVSLNATLAGATGIAVGNVIGSNMANIMLILGMAALIFPITVHPDAVRRDGMFMVAVTLLFVSLSLNQVLGPLEGALMVALVCGYIGYSLWRDSRSNDATAELHREEADEVTGLPQKLRTIIAFLVAGFAMLLLGSDLLVDGAVDIARAAGLSEEVIGLTLVALGTSLPELATAVVAAYRRHSDVCLGNVLGSNVFNILAILGICALADDLPISDKVLSFDLWVLLAVTVLLIPFMFSGWRINRYEGAFLVVLYVVFVACQFNGVGGSMTVDAAEMPVGAEPAGQTL
jgi:cation:H+ antiporter